MRRIEEGKENFLKTSDLNVKKIKRKSEGKNGKGESSEEEIVEVIITKEKLLELQTKNSVGIKSFINMLPFYGKEISLIKHRPNRELYPVGKAQEPSIKIVLNDFTKRIEQRIKENPNYFKKLKDSQKEKKSAINIDNFNQNAISNNNELLQEENNSEEIIGNIDKETSVNSTFSLASVINISSLQTIKYIDFLIYIFTILILIIEFILTYNFFSDHIKRYLYFKSSFKLLSDLTYIKYYVTEGILVTELNYYIMFDHSKEKAYIEKIQSDIKVYLMEFIDLNDYFDNPKVQFSKEYTDYITQTIVTVKTINNNKPNEEYHPFISAKTKLTNGLFQISTSKHGIDIEDKYVYELMTNLLDSYYLTYEKIIRLMVKDFDETTKKSGIQNIITFLIALFWSIAYLIIFYRLILNLDNDREKPINLFLTIKNSVFEDLKTHQKIFLINY